MRLHRQMAGIVDSPDRTNERQPTGWSFLAVRSLPAPIAIKTAIDLDTGLRGRLAAEHYDRFILVGLAFD